MQIELRDPKKIMKLKRLGSFHQSKLSFLRSFLREFNSWDYKRELFELDNDGYGVAIYSFKKEQRKYSLVCFANKLDDNERSDRVIATKWDASFTLYDGIPTKKDIERLSLNVPRQEIGRMTYKELTLSRANKSMRAFNYVVECLSNGNQPSTQKLSEVGYLYRTTAVYGSGKFGLADRFRIKNRPEIHGPFRLEMMLVYFVRQFTIDQVNFISKNKNPRKAIELDKNIARSLGIGNSTGLGMAPFIVNHPILLNNWILARETALKKIREIKDVKQEDFNYFFECLKNSINNINTWNTDSDYQKEKIKSLKIDLVKFIKYLEQEFDKKKEYLFNIIFNWVDSNLTEESIEYVVSLFLEPYDEIVDQLTPTMSADEEKFFNIPVERKIEDLRVIIEKNYTEILNIDFNEDKNIQNFWFISKNKEEPRVANRFEEIGSELEQPLAIARDVKSLYLRIKNLKNSMTIGRFLVDNNDLRHAVRRVFMIEKFPYSEIQDNIIGSELMPIDMLRLKLSFFGACKFDPRSDKWLRICMFQGAPLPDELKQFNDNWIYNSLN